MSYTSNQMTTNNITRFLESRNLIFRVHEFPPEKKSAVEIAEMLHTDPFIVFKTIVLTRQPKKKKILAVVPGPVEVDLKKVANWIGEKKVFLPSEKEAEAITGFQAGGISPLALYNKGFQVILDESAQDFPEIIISGGQRGVQIQIPVQSLIDITGALVVPISRETSTL